MKKESDFDSPQRQETFLSKASRLLPGSIEPPTQWLYKTVFLGVKQPGFEADHSSHPVPRFKVL